MTSIFRRLWADDYGVILSAELVLIGTVLVLGMLSGMVCFKTAVSAEMQDLGHAFSSLDQSFCFSGVASHGHVNCCNGCVCEGASTTGSAFQDTRRVSTQVAAEGAVAGVAVLNTQFTSFISDEARERLRNDEQETDLAPPPVADGFKINSEPSGNSDASSENLTPAITDEVDEQETELAPPPVADGFKINSEPSGNSDASSENLTPAITDEVDEQETELAPPPVADGFKINAEPYGNSDASSENMTPAITDAVDEDETELAPPPVADGLKINLESSSNVEEDVVMNGGTEVLSDVLVVMETSEFWATHREDAGAPFNPPFGTFSNDRLVYYAVPVEQPACPTCDVAPQIVVEPVMVPQPAACCGGRP